MGQVKALLHTCSNCGDDIDPRRLEQTWPIEPDNNPVHEAVLFYWGERCPEHEEGCPTCTAWKLYDKLIGETK